MIIPDLMIGSFAQNGDRNPIPATDPTGFINFSQGYTPFYELSLTSGNPQAKAVERQGMNQLFYQLTQNARSWQQQSYAPWISTMAGGYELGAYVVRVVNGAMQVFRSMAANNVSDPATNSTQWELQPAWSSMITRNFMPGGGYSLTGTEVISSPVDMNDLPTGSYYFSTDATVQGSQNFPTIFGESAIKSTVECKRWGPASLEFGIQRVTSLRGYVFVRRLSASVWGNWEYQMLVRDVQSNRALFGTPVTTNATAYTFTTNPTFTPVSGQGNIIYLWFGTAMPVASGAITLDVNGIGARPIRNQANAELSAGELFGWVALTYQASVWRVVSSMGAMAGTLLVPPTNNHYTTKKYVDDSIAAIGYPQWVNIQNKPNVVVNGDPTATLQSMELAGSTNSTPYIDFHYNNSSSDFDGRVICNGPSTLSVAIMYGGLQQTALSVRTDSVGSSVQFEFPIYANGSVVIPSSRRISFTDSGGALSFTAQIDPSGGNDFAINRFNSSSGFLGQPVRISKATGAITLEARPTWASLTPWDSGNFNPATKVTLGAANNSVGTKLQTGGIGNIAGQIGAGGWDPNQNPLVIGNSGAGAASSCITFLRDGAYGVVLGLDTDNVLKIGGFSMGAVAYPVIHSGNYATYLPITLAGMAYNQVGQYGLFVCGGGSSSGYDPVTPGTLIAGASLGYTNAGQSGNGGQPPGTWRCHSFLYNHDGTTTDSTGIFQRVA